MTPGPSRRQFLAAAGSCAAHLAFLGAASPGLARTLFALPPGGQDRVVAREPWGRLEAVADGVWALISTPLEDRTTLCNGGIVAGRSGVLLVEAVASPEGAAWLARQARELTGRWPDAVVLSHHHGDHTGGVAGLASGDIPSPPRVHATRPILDRVLDTDRARAAGGTPVDSRRAPLLEGAAIVPAGAPASLDLGDRTVSLVPRDGHTASDITVELDDPPVVFCGDLVWNRMVPNYVDAVPSRLSGAVRALLGDDPRTVTVPGHGPLAGAADLALYLELLDHLEEAGRQAHREGWSAAEAAERYRLPGAVAEWALFSPRYPEVAIGAWLRELRS